MLLILNQERLDWCFIKTNSYWTAHRKGIHYHRLKQLSWWLTQFTEIAFSCDNTILFYQTAMLCNSTTGFHSQSNPSASVKVWKGFEPQSPVIPIWIPVSLSSFVSTLFCEKTARLQDSVIQLGWKLHGIRKKKKTLGGRGANALNPRNKFNLSSPYNISCWCHSWHRPPFHKKCKGSMCVLGVYDHDYMCTYMSAGIPVSALGVDLKFSKLTTPERLLSVLWCSKTTHAPWEVLKDRETAQEWAQRLVFSASSEGREPKDRKHQAENTLAK